MADLKFSCPHCQQHIAADTGYAGMQISCPSCNGNLVVPGSAPAPAPAPAPTLSVRTSAPAAPPPPPSAPAPAPAGPTRASGGGCPSCGNAMPRGAVLCTSCGYNTATGQRTVGGRPAALGKPRTDQWEEPPWYKTAIPYAGASLLILGILYWLGRENPAMRLAFFGGAALYMLVVHIIVVVSAFGEGVLQGILTLCLLPYAVYYVYVVNDNSNLKILYGIKLALYVGVKIATAGD